jgi:catechol 2,3-dioxygenase-like lactoylglutathione lyase family enzyme
MIDHFTLRVHDYQKAKTFYAVALEPLGYRQLAEFEGYAGLGADGKPDLWLTGDPQARPVHLALAARDRKAVDAFYQAALAAGAADNGKPGIREDYGPTYYAAFVLDPSGHNLEVVCHEKPRRAAAKPRKRTRRASPRPRTRRRARR